MSQKTELLLPVMTGQPVIPVIRIADLAHAVPLANVFAEDIVQPSLPREAALASAPKHDEECYLVPPVLG